MPESFFSRIIPSTVGLALLVLFANSCGGTSTGVKEDDPPVDPPPTYSADIYILRNAEVVPASGVNFCLDDTYCAVTNAAGRVEISGLPVKSDFQIGFIEGADPKFMVVLGDGQERRKPNLVNYVNTHALLGMTPKDTAVVGGINNRTVIYVDEATVPVQELIDQFNESVFHVGIGEPGSVSKFDFDDGKLRLFIDTAGYYPGEEAVDTLIAAALRGISWANDRYRSIPGRDPETYTVDVNLGSSVQTGWGNVLIRVSEGERLSISNWGFFGLEGTTGLTIGTGMSSYGLPAIKHYVEMGVAAILTSLPSFAEASYGTFMTHFNTEDAQINRQWTEKDVQIATMNHLVDDRTRFTPTGASPVLAPSGKRK